MKRLFTWVMLAGLLLGFAYAQDVKEVTFWTSHSDPDLITLKEIVQNFNDEHPDINVTLVQIPPGGRCPNRCNEADDRRARRHRPGRVYARPLRRRAARRRRLIARLVALYER